MNLYEYRFYFEPFIIPLILVYYLISSKKKNFLIFSAFFFVWLGDLLLLIELTPIFLQWAVFFYWIMQLCFIWAYLKYWKGYLFREHLLGILFYGSYLIVFMNHVYHAL